MLLLENQLAASRYEELDFCIPELKPSLDYIVCDAPGWTDEITLQLANEADLIVLTSGTATDDMRPAIRLHHELLEAGIDPDRVVVVLNRVHSDAQAREASDYLIDMIIVSPGALPFQRVYERACSVGQSITEVTGGPGEKAKTVIDAVIKLADRVARQRSKPAPRRFKLKDGEAW